MTSPLRFTHGSLLRLAAATAALSLTVACTITSGDGNGPNGTPDNSAGMGGDTASGGTGGSGGSGTGGADATGGTGGTQTEALDCHADGSVEGVPAEAESFDCAGLEGDDLTYCECMNCAVENCSEEYGECYATGPDSACGWDASGEQGGEFYSAYLSMQSDAADGIFSEAFMDDYYAAAKSPTCGAASASSVTQSLLSCMVGTESIVCQNKCGWVNAE